jgi:hypothetical protein
MTTKSTEDLRRQLSTQINEIEVEPYAYSQRFLKRIGFLGTIEEIVEAGVENQKDRSVLKDIAELRQEMALINRSGPYKKGVKRPSTTAVNQKWTELMRRLLVFVGINLNKR